MIPASDNPKRIVLTLFPYDSTLPWTLPAPEANWCPAQTEELTTQIETPDRISDPEASHYAESSAREKLVEHVFLGELLRGLWRRDIRDLEVLRPEVDSGGYDLALECGGVIRHVQLKSSHRDAKRAAITANMKLVDRPSACILWIYFDPVFKVCLTQSAICALDNVSA